MENFVTNRAYSYLEQQMEYARLQQINQILPELPVQLTKCVYQKLHNRQKGAQA